MAWVVSADTLISSWATVRIEPTVYAWAARRAFPLGAHPYNCKPRLRDAIVAATMRAATDGGWQVRRISV